jgi:hypothetical protein
MTPSQIKAQLKATALNAILKIYHPLTKNHYFDWTDESFGEQRDSRVREICETLEKDLKALKTKTQQPCK